MSKAIERLDEIRARLEAATPGPWKRWETMPGHVAATTEDRWVCVASGDAWKSDHLVRENAELIAHAPADLALLEHAGRMVAVAPCEFTYSDGGDCNAHAADENDACWPCRVRRELEGR